LFSISCAVLSSTTASFSSSTLFFASCNCATDAQSTQYALHNMAVVKRKTLKGCVLLRHMESEGTDTYYNEKYTEFQRSSNSAMPHNQQHFTISKSCPSHYSLHWVHTSEARGLSGSEHAIGQQYQLTRGHLQWTTSESNTQHYTTAPVHPLYKYIQQNRVYK